MRGVNYLDRHFKRHLSEPGGAIFDNDVASAIAFVRRQFTESGTRTWHRPSVEWLLVHLVTEIGATPHSDRQGCNAPTIEGAYQEVIQQFVSLNCMISFSPDVPPWLTARSCASTETSSVRTFRPQRS